MPNIVWWARTKNKKYLAWTKFRPRSYYAGGVWKRRFHSENASNVFRSHSWCRRNLKTHQSLVSLDLCLRETRSRKSYCHRFWKTLCFPSTLKGMAGILKFLRFEKRFWKASFSWWISVDRRPNRRNIAANFFRAVWKTTHYISHL